jgi:hypothetical protein
MYLGSSSAGTVILVLVLLLLFICLLYGVLVLIRIHHNKKCSVECTVPCQKLKYDLEFRDKEYTFLDLSKGGRNEKYFAYFDKLLINNENTTNDIEGIERSAFCPENQSKGNSRANLTMAKAKVSLG